MPKRIRINLRRCEFQGANARFWFQDSGFNRWLPDISLCLEESTERSDGNPGRRLGKISMVARNASWVIGHTMVLCLEGSTLHGF